MAVLICGEDPSLRWDVMTALVSALDRAGLEVVNQVDAGGTDGICLGEPREGDGEKGGKEQDVQAFFSGTFQARRVEPLLLVTLDLSLSTYPRGRRPIWRTTVENTYVAALAGKKRAVSLAAEMAAEAFRKDFPSRVRKTEGNGGLQNHSAESVQGQCLSRK